jgi:hypothetical protein
VVAVEGQEEAAEFYLLGFYTVVVRRKYTDVSEEHVECAFLRKAPAFHLSTRRYIPEDETLHNHRCENLRSYKT